MTKVQFIVICFLILGRSEICHAQQLMEKNEIYNSWIKSLPTSANCDMSIEQSAYDAKIEAKILTTIRSLRLRGVDTLLVLVSSHPGVLIADTCRASIYPAEVYIFWRVGGMDSLKKIPNKCGLDGLESNCSQVFGFFSQHQHQLEQEYIMPVILSARKKANRIFYNQIISSDEDEYVLYYSVHGHCKRFAFSRADITNKSNLFYSDNIESHAYKWFVTLQKECKKMERK